MKRTRKPRLKPCLVTVSISAKSKKLLQQHAFPRRRDGRYDLHLDPEMLVGLRQIDADIDKAIAYVCRLKH